MHAGLKLDLQLSLGLKDLRSIRQVSYKCIIKNHGQKEIKNSLVFIIKLCTLDNTHEAIVCLWFIKLHLKLLIGAGVFV